MKPSDVMYDGAEPLDMLLPRIGTTVVMLGVVSSGVVTPSVSEGPGRRGGAIRSPPAPPGPSLTLGVTEANARKIAVALFVAVIGRLSTVAPASPAAFAMVASPTTEPPPESIVISTREAVTLSMRVLP